MRHRIGTTLGIALALAGAIVTAPDAAPRTRQIVTSPLMRAETFSVSGRASGPVAGEIRVDGIAYRLAPDARIYEVGRGFVPGGTAYVDRVVNVSGVKVRSTLVVHSVLVRPAPDPFTGPNPAGAASAEEAASAR